MESLIRQLGCQLGCFALGSQSAAGSQCAAWLTATWQEASHLSRFMRLRTCALGGGAVVIPCATYTSRMDCRAYKTFPTGSLPVARHCYLFGGLYGQVGQSLGIISLYTTTIQDKDIVIVVGWIWKRKMLSPSSKSQVRTL